MVIKKLSELSPGEKGVVKGVTGKGLLARRLLDMGLVSGAEISVLRVAPLGDTIEVEVKGYNLSLRKEEAEQVLVEVKKSE